MTPTSRQAVLYIRQSRDDPRNAHPISVESQEAELRAYCRSRGLRVLRVYVDKGKSGGTMSRPAFNRLRADIGGGELDRARVIVKDLSRLTRSSKVGDLEDILELFTKHHMALASLSEDLDLSGPAGEMFVKVLAIIAGFQRRQDAERSKATHRLLREKGLVRGPAPYGFDAVPSPTERDRNGRPLKVLAPNAAELEVVRRVFGLRDGEKKSYQAIADALNIDGIRTKRAGFVDRTGRAYSGKWHDVQVRDIILNRDVYAEHLTP